MSEEKYEKLFDMYNFYRDFANNSINAITLFGLISILLFFISNFFFSFPEFVNTVIFLSTMVTFFVGMLISICFVIMSNFKLREMSEFIENYNQV